MNNSIFIHEKSTVTIAMTQRRVDNGHFREQTILIYIEAL